MELLFYALLVTMHFHVLITWLAPKTLIREQLDLSRCSKKARSIHLSKGELQAIMKRNGRYLSYLIGWFVAKQLMGAAGMFDPGSLFEPASIGRYLLIVLSPTIWAIGYFYSVIDLGLLVDEMQRREELKWVKA